MSDSSKRKSALLEYGTSRKSGSVPIIDPSVLSHRGDFFSNLSGRSGCNSRRSYRSAWCNSSNRLNACERTEKSVHFSACSTTVVPLPSKQNTRVRLPLRAPVFANHHVCASHPPIIPKLSKAGHYCPIYTGECVDTWIFSAPCLLQTYAHNTPRVRSVHPVQNRSRLRGVLNRHPMTKDS